MANIAKRANGKWRARYRDEAGKEHARHFDRKVDAQRWVDEITAAVVTGQYVDPKAGRVTFTSFYGQWSNRQVWVPGTVKAMDLAAKSVTFGDVPLGRLRRSHVEQWVKAMETKGLQPGTIKTRFVNVRSVLRAAARDKVIATDPSDGVTLPRIRRTEAAMTIPTSEQVGAIMRAADDHFQAFVALAAFAGMRLGEVAALQVGDVDFLRRTVQVRRQVQRAGGGTVEIRAPKYGSERDVYVPEQLTDLIAAHVQKHCPGDEPTRWLFAAGAVLPDAKNCSSRGEADGHHLVTDDNGVQPPHQNTVGHRWRKACKKAKVEGTTLHDLRHYYASGLIAAGCDVVTVQRALGHAKATTTLNTYSHLWSTAEDRTRAAAVGLIAMALSIEDVTQTEPKERFLAKI